MPDLDTIEGPLAVVDAMEKVQQESGKPKLEWSDGLALAARDHCLDAGSNALNGTLGTDGSTYFDRIQRYGEAGIYRAENITFGGNGNA